MQIEPDVVAVVITIIFAKLIMSDLLPIWVLTQMFDNTFYDNHEFPLHMSDLLPIWVVAQMVDNTFNDNHNFSLQSEDWSPLVLQIGCCHKIG